ncbi:hypothetical protein MAR_038070 [Mya arenaria]|uniref:Uncharacterized protein n=1 Tax=Mya arenaria TaxID=6604 RepID=A0ABY7FZ67_MYAAR|nr:hypothetical protein MAR_038070 [Mya arenaria]
MAIDLTLIDFLHEIEEPDVAADRDKTLKACLLARVQTTNNCTQTTANMVDFHVSFNMAMVIAAVLGELVSVLFFNHHSAWGRQIGDRFLITALVQYFTIRSWEDAAILAMWLALVYLTLEAPHVVHDHRSFSYFFVHALHKFAVLFVMIFALFHFKNY